MTTKFGIQNSEKKVWDQSYFMFNRTMKIFRVIVKHQTLGIVQMHANAFQDNNGMQ